MVSAQRKSYDVRTPGATKPRHRLPAQFPAEVAPAPAILIDIAGDGEARVGDYTRSRVSGLTIYLTLWYESVVVTGWGVSEVP